jgi:hypothetical protein
MNRFLSVQAEIKNAEAEIKNAEAALANLRLELDRIREQSPIVKQMCTKNALLDMALSDSIHYKNAWKVIVERGLYQNISTILSNCLLVIKPDSVGQSVYDAAIERTGVGCGDRSEPDVRFVLPFIKYMKSKGLFNPIYNGVKDYFCLKINDFKINDFSVRVNHKLLWKAMIEFLIVPKWKPWDFAEEAAMVAAKTAAMAEKAAIKAELAAAKAAEKAARKAEKAAIKADLAAAKAAEKAARKAEKAAELAAAKKAAHNANAV